jgi:tetratricopeptide (TPR) repeat protein
MRSPKVFFFVLILLHLSPTGSHARNLSAEDYIESGDREWKRRGVGHSRSVAAEEPIGEAIRSFEHALAADRENLEARWKLLRALYFQGEHTSLDDSARLKIFNRGKQLAEEGIDILAASVGGRRHLDASMPVEVARLLADQPEAASIYHWAAAHWGLVGRLGGKISAVRQGVAHKVRDYAEITTALDERIESAGGHRILGRLHAEAPRIPFITGWVDHQLAIVELERAVELVPEDLLSRLYLIEALLEYSSDRRSEALAMLDELLIQSPDQEWIVEGTRVLEDARALRDRIRR